MSSMEEGAGILDLGDGPMKTRPATAKELAHLRGKFVFAAWGMRICAFVLIGFTAFINIFLLSMDLRVGLGAILGLGFMDLLMLGIALLLNWVAKHSVSGAAQASQGATVIEFEGPYSYISRRHDPNIDFIGEQVVVIPPKWSSRMEEGQTYRVEAAIVGDVSDISEAFGGTNFHAVCIFGRGIGEKIDPTSPRPK